MSDVRYRYLVALSESTDAEDLQALLNEKAADGFELFMLHEVDSRIGRMQYNCIFYKIEEHESSTEGETIELTDITDFKNQIEKIYNTNDTYNQYLETQKKIQQTQKQIKEIKTALESDSNSEEKKPLNDSIKDKINQLNELKQKLALISDSSQLYNRIKSDKITINLSEELIELAENNKEDNIITRIIKLRQDITDKLGYVIPNIRYSDGVELEPYQYRIDVREIPAATGFIYPSYRMFYKGQGTFKTPPKESIIAVDPIYLFDVFWVKGESTKDFWDKGLSASDVIAQHLAYTCIKHAPELLDYKDMNKFIDIVRKNNFDLAENLIPDIITVGDLRYLLANLVKEMVSIKDITFIFENLMDLYNYAAEKEILLEKLRVCLRRQISNSRSDENNNIYAIVVDPTLDKFLQDNLIVPENINPFIEIPKDDIEIIMNTTAKLIEKEHIKIENTVLLCSSEIRQPLFALVEDYIPGLSVLAHEEISSEVNIEEIGTLDKKLLYKPKRKAKEDL